MDHVLEKRIPFMVVFGQPELDEQSVNVKNMAERTEVKASLRLEDADGANGLANVLRGMGLMSVVVGADCGGGASGGMRGDSSSSSSDSGIESISDSVSGSGGGSSSGKSRMAQLEL
jgi:hypothetical protein